MRQTKLIKGCNEVTIRLYQWRSESVPFKAQIVERLIDTETGDSCKRESSFSEARASLAEGEADNRINGYKSNGYKEVK